MPRRRPGQWHEATGFVAAFAILAAACGEPECETIEDPQDRDYCMFDRVIAHAEQNETDQAIADLRQIRSGAIRAATIDALISRHPDGLGPIQVRQLCNGLPELQARVCHATWERPHLWSP